MAVLDEAAEGVRRLGQERPAGWVKRRQAGTQTCFQWGQGAGRLAVGRGCSCLHFRESLFPFWGVTL